MNGLSKLTFVPVHLSCLRYPSRGKLEQRGQRDRKGVSQIKAKELVYQAVKLFKKEY